MEKSISIYRDYYQYEEINGNCRENVELIPEAAFREVLANGLMHRTWDVNAQASGGSGSHIATAQVNRISKSWKIQ